MKKLLIVFVLLLVLGGGDGMALREVLKHDPALKDVNRLGMLESIRCAGLTLWDEANQRLVSFGQYARMKAMRVPATV